MGVRPVGQWVDCSQAQAEAGHGHRRAEAARGDRFGIHDSVDYGLVMPDRDEFEWDEDNEAHIAEHDVDPYEAEEAAADPGAVFRRRGKDRFGNPRYLCVGKTEDGRILFVVMDRKEARRWRVGSARDAGPTARKAYRKRNR